MSSVVKKHRLVADDQLAAAAWYDEQQPGLGDAFLDESEAAISTRSTRAEFYGIRFADVRCVRLKRFHHYGVFYVIRDAEVWLLAIHHGARDDWWLRERISQLA